MAIHQTSVSASASTSTSVSPSSSYSYDVFINLHGQDVKETFSKHLYRLLILRGFRVFLGREELEGENLTSQIEAAIETACVHVAVFSPGYAESKSCLDELVLMVKSGAIILPVFYEVEPEELMCLRGEGGVYAQALHNLEKKSTYDSESQEEKPLYDPNTIENWREALSSVAELRGFDLEDCDGDEEELVDEIVQRVVKKMEKSAMDGGRLPTGLEERVQEFENTVLLQQHHHIGEAKVVGIVGLGGVGKTALAKAFFSRNRSDYDRSSFLCDVRYTASKLSLTSLQSKLIKDLTQLDIKINTQYEGIEILTRHLSGSQSLIILDDVDHADQLHALLPATLVLNPHSLILITSRDKAILRRSGIRESSIYTVTGFVTEHYRELFCFHAFHQRYPAVGFEEVVDEFLVACHGLPLSLKVIGALLYGQNDLEHWKTQLAKLSKILPVEMRKRLQISYDSLDKEEKHIFSDIACFFIGEDRDTAIRTWDGSGWKGSLGFANLQNKCLVEVDSENRVRMHDHLRDLGKCQFPLLKAEGDSLGSISNLLQSDSAVRVFLRWDRCPYFSLPPCISLRNLRVLKLSGPELETLWQSETQAPVLLRQLNIEATLQRVPKSIGLLKHLEKIEMNDTIEPLPDEFFHLPSLKHLRLRTRMMALPDSLGNLTKLRHMDLSGCTDLQTLPPTLGNLSNLKYLSLNGCSRLAMLPDTFGNLIRLRHLHLAGCCTLTISSETFGKIRRLETLDLSSCLGMEALPPQVTYQSSLEELNLWDTNLKELPIAIGNLRNLEILKLHCSSLEMLPPSLGNLRSLRELNLYFCNKLRCLPDSVGQLTQLARLTIHCAIIEHLPVDVMRLNNLRILKVTGCSLLEVPFGSVEKPGLLDSSNDNCMARLKHIDLQGTRIKKISFREGFCPKLEYLNLSSCNELVEVGALPATLISLDLHESPALQKITGLSDLENLRLLNIEGCKEVEELPGFETLKSLPEMRASGCPKLKLHAGI